ncbi:MAG: hypothetical protein VXZ72_04790 [Chlamydiota bacterium]|nr:hypothetical protein [Chlamydiota bacterium]
MPDVPKLFNSLTNISTQRPDIHIKIIAKISKLLIEMKLISKENEREFYSGNKIDYCEGTFDVDQYLRKLLDETELMIPFVIKSILLLARKFTCKRNKKTLDAECDTKIEKLFVDAPKEMIQFIIKFKSWSLGLFGEEE